MRVIITGGGTGGHLYPGVALAEGVCAQQPGSEVLFIGTSRLLDQQALADRGFRLQALQCGGVKGLGLGRRLVSLGQFPRAVFTAWRILRDFKPDVVFGVGGYVTGPVLIAAKICGVPICIHEQNSVPGLANRLAGRLADKVCISLPCLPEFPTQKTVLTGNPVRREILLAAQEQVQEKQAQPKTLVVLGGSQGAHKVNMLMLEALKTLMITHADLRVIHQTGTADYESVCAAYADMGVQVRVEPFIHDMARVYRQADLVISRAGATTLAELAVMGIPALLIPYPYAADDHQVTNGQYYEKAGGCKVLVQSALNGEILAQTISECLQNFEELPKMATRMRSLGVTDATDKIVQVCQALVAGAGKNTHH